MLSRNQYIIAKNTKGIKHIPTFVIYWFMQQNDNLQPIETFLGVCHNTMKTILYCLITDQFPEKHWTT